MSEPKANAVVQIGIVVRSTDEAMRHYAKLLGIDDWNINYVDTDNGKGRNFRVDGEDVSVKAKIAWTNIGDIELELIEPQDDNSIYARYLRSNGPGVHHLMFGTSDYQDTLDNMQQKGVKNIASGELQATRFQLFDTVDMLGTISEFAEGDALIPDI
jgi:4-hydroxyphenylpyruvate dioxygenase-like putative hemolysin